MKKIKRILSLTLLMVIILSNTAFASIGNFKDDTKGYILGEISTDSILESYNEDEVVPIASITKIMTFILVQDAIADGSVALTDKVEITDDIQAVGGSNMYLEAGKVATVDNLLKGLMIVSGNDAAYALAKTVSGTEEKFVELMNEKAKEIGLSSAKFINSSGLPDETINEENSMTTKDVFLMAEYAIENFPSIIDIASMEKLEIPELEFDRVSTIPLLGQYGVDGLKTGTTDDAGFCLVSTFKPKDNQSLKDKRFIFVLMGANSEDDRRNITESVVKYASENYLYREVVNKDELYKDVKVNKVDKGKIKIYPKENISMLYDKTERILYNEKVDVASEEKLKSGDKVGVLSIKQKDGKVYNVDLLVQDSYEKATIGTRFKRLGRDILNITKNLLNF